RGNLTQLERPGETGGGILVELNRAGRGVVALLDAVLLDPHEGLDDARPAGSGGPLDEESAIDAAGTPSGRQVDNRGRRPVLERLKKEPRPLRSPGDGAARCATCCKPEPATEKCKHGAIPLRHEGRTTGRRLVNEFRRMVASERNGRGFSAEAAPERE